MCYCVRIATTLVRRPIEYTFAYMHDSTARACVCVMCARECGDAGECVPNTASKHARTHAREGGFLVFAKSAGIYRFVCVSVCGESKLKVKWVFVCAHILSSVCISSYASHTHCARHWRVRVCVCVRKHTVEHLQSSFMRDYERCRFG